jgi:hypothetical protein
MRVFLPHAQSNNKLSSSVISSPREDKRKSEEDEDTEVTAKKFRVEVSAVSRVKSKKPLV